VKCVYKRARLSFCAVVFAVLYCECLTPSNPVQLSIYSLTMESYIAVYIVLHGLTVELRTADSLVWRPVGRDAWSPPV